MRSVLCLALAVACVAAGEAPGLAQPVPAPASRVRQRADADAEFNRARALFDGWCKQTEERHAAAPRDLPLTLRLADCRLLNGQLDEARRLLEEAEAASSREAVRKARVAATVAGRNEAKKEIESVRKADEWRQACHHFEASLRLEVSTAAQLAVAACQLRRGDLLAARQLLAACRAALSPTATSDELSAIQLSLADALVREVDHMQPRLVVQTPAGFGGSITIDDRAATDGEVVPVDPGDHSVRATLRDGYVDETSVDLGLSAARTVTIGHGRRLSGRRRLAFWGLVGASAGAAIGATLSLWAMEREADELRGPNPTYNPTDPTSKSRLCDRPGVFTLECEPGVDASRFESRATLFQVTAIGTAVLIAGAVVVHFTTPKGDLLRIAPAVDQDTIGATAAGHF
jgi:hypothetical protein